jgi:hypothetical protein
MDGIEAVRIIRNEINSEYAKTVPIIALTANAITGNEEMFLSKGFNAFISKPIDIMRLDTILNQWVRDKQTEEILRNAEKMRSDMLNAANSAELEELPFGGFDIEVKGVDLERGISRYEGEDAYLGVLRSYAIHTPSLLEKLRSLAPETLPEYAVTVHGLKGSSYGICADDIGRQAEELEHAAKEGNYERVRGENDAFILKVEAALSGLQELFQSCAAEGPEKKKAGAPDRQTLEKLLEASKRFKPIIMEEFLAELESREYESGGDLVVWLREQLDNLEYDAIRERLEAECAEVV